ncbi:unnamed protein product [Cercopithifilaria johnstoni]|uniref:Uncharacterized protein n=1 Tax=Cercopithifilaria johnstoni TaxID=2874296 RepID=A0A8J2M816_9BILA|nr:unnamed protein product [Cercopithifilaria johnstoni]
MTQTIIKLRRHHHYQQQQLLLQQQQQQQEQQQHDAIMTAYEAQLTSESGSSKRTLESETMHNCDFRT